MIKIPQKIEKVLLTLQNNGYKSYIVGGCVRDMLLLKTPTDYDITTSATPQQIMTLFKKVIPTGIVHGTVTVIQDNTPIEITTFRTEKTYSDNRRPDSVEFVTDIKDDLSRRDFTINAMAYNKNEGILDFYNGKEDIKNRVLRTVGNPDKRFTEDALRILRLFRFSSVLDFNIEEKTLKSALNNAYLLQNISKERIFSELKKALNGINPSALKSLTDNNSLGFLGFKISQDYSLYNKIKDSFPLNLYSFIYLSKSNYDDVLNNLKVPNNIKKYCKLLNNALSEPVPTEKSKLKLILNEIPVNILSDSITFRKVILDQNINKLKEMLNEIIYNKEPYTIKDLAINGNTLKKHGFKGNEIGKELTRLRNHVINCPLDNTTEKLIKLIRLP